MFLQYGPARVTRTQVVKRFRGTYILRDVIGTNADALSKADVQFHVSKCKHCCVQLFKAAAVIVPDWDWVNQSGCELSLLS